MVCIYARIGTRTFSPSGGYAIRRGVHIAEATPPVKITDISGSVSIVYLNLLDLKTLQGLKLSSNPAVKPCNVLLPFEFAILLLFCVVVFYHLPFNQNVA